MTDNIFDFAKTNQALGTLSETIVRLDSALKSKQNTLALQQKESTALLARKEQQLEELKMASSNAARRIDEIVNSLDNVLEDNGSGNNNN